MTQKKDLENAYRRLGGQLAEGYVKDLPKEICAILYGRDYEEGRDLPLHRVIESHVKENYKLKLHEGKRRKHEKKCAEKLKIDLKGKPMKPLFVNTLEVDEERFQIDGNYEEECYRNKRFQIRYEQIGHDFPGYYKKIGTCMKENPHFFKEDLNYILLQAFSLMEEEEYRIGREEFEQLKIYEFLSFSKKKITSNREKDFENSLKYTEEQLKKDIGFPFVFEKYIDQEGKCLCLKKTNLKIQLALLFYPEFQKCFLRNESSGQYGLGKISDMFKNIVEISLEGYDEKVDDTLFPYLVEYATGANLSAEYAKYYCILEKHVKGNKLAKEYLYKIFDHVSEMPNVFSRIQIIRDFMESVLLFDGEIEKQLLIMRNITAELSEYYRRMSDKIIEVIKSNVKGENLRMQYLCGIKGWCCGLGYMKNIFGAAGKNPGIFVKNYEENGTKARIFKELQKRYIKRYKQLLYYK